MAIRKNVRVLFLTMLISLLPLGGAWAQTQSPDAADATDGGGDVFYPETRYLQRLTWVGDEHALRYEVVVEKESPAAAGEFNRIMQQFTEAVYIEFSLPPGKYRYQVIPYDTFGRPASESQWMNFEILAAVKPELNSFSPGFLLFDEKTDFAVNLYGNNLLRDAEIYLRQIGSSNAPIVPVARAIEQNGSGAQLHFNFEQFQQPGFYVIFVKNPGGQETSKGELIIGYPDMDPNYVEPIFDPNRRFDTHLGALWLPIFHMQGGMDEIFGSSMQLVSAAVRFSSFIHKPNLIFQPGLEVAVSWYALKVKASDHNAEVQVTAATAYLGLQRWFGGDRAAFTLRAGFGIGYQTGIYNEEKDVRANIYSMNADAPHMDFGASFLITFKGHFTLDLGIQYTQTLVEKDASGFFRPSIGLGWRF